MEDSSDGVVLKITCAGGGPAGFYFAILMKLADARHDITVLERHADGFAPGWGVVFWDGLLHRLYEKDPVSAHRIESKRYRWENQVVAVEGRAGVLLPGYGYSIGRREFLDVLAARAGELGVDVRYGLACEADLRHRDSDLLVACDGSQSTLRRRDTDHFGTKVQEGRNKYIWLGTTKIFDSFTFAFIRTGVGWIWFHAYAFDLSTSTVIVECSPETWAGLGFDGMDGATSAERLATIFAEPLGGHPLLESRGGGYTGSPWLCFPTVTNARWHHRNVVLMGDAAHTTHFSIGSGTHLAIEDAISLAEGLSSHGCEEWVFEAYEHHRKASLQRYQMQARTSARWFEQVPRYIDLDTRTFGQLLFRRRSRLLPHTNPRAFHLAIETVKRGGIGSLGGAS